MPAPSLVCHVNGKTFYFDSIFDGTSAHWFQTGPAFFLVECLVECTNQHNGRKWMMTFELTYSITDPFSSHSSSSSVAFVSPEPWINIPTPSPTNYATFNTFCIVCASDNNFRTTNAWQFALACSMRTVPNVHLLILLLCFRIRAVSLVWRMSLSHEINWRCVYPRLHSEEAQYQH